MSWGEFDRWLLGEENARYYHDDLEDAGARPERDASRRKTIKAQELPWENSPHGLLKHLANPQMDLRIETIDAYMQIIPPGSHSGRHRQLAEQAFYVLEGRGYDLHVDCDVRSLTPTTGILRMWSSASTGRREMSSMFRRIRSVSISTSIVSVLPVSS